MIFAVMMLMSTAASYAIDFGFAGVDKVSQSGNKFFAYTAGGEAVEISAWQFKQINEADGYYILSVGDKKVIAAGDEFVVEPKIVESVNVSAANAEQPKVFFTDGSFKLFKNAEWLKALKGQEVRRIYINTPTWEFENYATVDEGTNVVYHNKVAPTKRVTAPTATTAPVAPAPAAGNKQTTDAPSNANAPKTIKFSIKH